MRRVHNRTTVRQRLIARQFVVSPASDRSGRSARGGECLKAKSGKNAGRAGVPWVGNHEAARTFVKLTEGNCLVELSDAHILSCEKIPPFYAPRTCRSTCARTTDI